MTKTISTAITAWDISAIIRSAPPWLLDIPLGGLCLQVRTFNALDVKGFKIVGDMACFSSEMLLKLPFFGVTSLRDLCLRLNSANERGLSSQIDGALMLGSEFGDLISLASVIVAAVSSLPPSQEKAVRSRMGLGVESMTLEEIGKHIGVTRERVRQLETIGMSKIGCDSVWSDVLKAKLTKLLDGRDDPLPFSGLSILDAWFSGIEKIEEPFIYILGHANIIDREFSLIKANGQLFVSRLSQDEWDNQLKQAMRLLEDGVAHELSLTEARRRVEDLLSKNGRELRSELWVAAKQFAYFSYIDPVLISYGCGSGPMILAVIYDSERPIHYSEITRLIFKRYAKDVNVRSIANILGQVALLYGNGFYGLLRHCPLSYQERELVCNEALEIICSSGRQWSSTELVDILNDRGLNFNGNLNIYTLDITLKDSIEVNYLGRNIWVRSTEAVQRIDVRQAVTSLLIQAGKPLSNSEIKEALQNERGISHSFQIFPSGSIISVGAGIWGLIERDLPFNADEQVQLSDILNKILLDRNNGIHTSEIFSCLEGVFEPVSRITDPNVIFAVALRSDLLSKSSDNYLFLSSWGEPRRLKIPLAVIEALKKAGPSGLKAREITKYASAIIGRPIHWHCIYLPLSKAGAVFNQTTRRWKLSEAPGTSSLTV